MASFLQVARATNCSHALFWFPAISSSWPCIIHSLVSGPIAAFSAFLADFVLDSASLHCFPKSFDDWTYIVSNQDRTCARTRTWKMPAIHMSSTCELLDDSLAPFIHMKNEAIACGVTEFESNKKMRCCFPHCPHMYKPPTDIPTSINRNMRNAIFRIRFVCMSVRDGQVTTTRKTNWSTKYLNILRNKNERKKAS